GGRSSVFRTKVYKVSFTFSLWRVDLRLGMLPRLYQLMIYLLMSRYYANVGNTSLLPEEYRLVSAAVLLLVLLKTQPGRVAANSGFIDQSPGAIIFLLSGFAANPIHLIHTGGVVFRCCVVESS